MGNVLLTLLAAERRGPDEAQIWAIIILGIITALGQLLRKRQQKRQPPPRPGARGSATGLPAPAEPTRRPPKPQRLERSPGQAKPAAKARPVLPVELPPRRPLRPPAPPAVPPPVSAPASVAESAPFVRGVAPVAPPKRRALPLEQIRTRLTRLLRSRHDARTAFALSEVLSPPLALR